MEDMMNFLADAPAEQRKMMLKSRIDMFLASDEAHRRAGMKDMLLALSHLSSDKRKRLISTRSQVIAELPPEKQVTLMMSRVALSKELPPEVHQTDMQSVMEVLPEIPEGLRQGFIESMSKAMAAAGMQVPTKAT